MASTQPNKYTPSSETQPSELEIVDTFTKLIFGSDQDFSPQELGIIQVTRLVDDNVALDRAEAMGVYLRALGVKEMISLVTRVRRDYPLLASSPPSSSLHQHAQF